MMTMKGTAFVARKNFIVEKFGAAAWDEVMARIAVDIPFFARPIMPTTRIPIEDFFAFQHALAARFWRGSAIAYWEMGAASAQWSLTEGPYKQSLNKQDLRSLVDTFPGMFVNYYNAGQIVAKLDGQSVVIELVGLPVYDVSFEPMVMGYFHRALELYTRRKVPHQRISGGAPDARIEYRFLVG